jgi:hypothetical protein
MGQARLNRQYVTLHSTTAYHQCGSAERSRYAMSPLTSPLLFAGGAGKNALPFQLTKMLDNNRRWREPCWARTSDPLIKS